MVTLHVIEIAAILIMAFCLYYVYCTTDINEIRVDEKIKNLSKDIKQCDEKIEDSILNVKADLYKRICVPVVKTDKNTKLPHKGSEEAAGIDLHALLENESVKILPHQTVKINTGLKMAIPQGYFGAIYARSGLATKQGLRPANCVGVIDSDYRGEIIVALHNDSNEDGVINNGDRIAQLVIQPYKNIIFSEVEELNDTERGDGGFGHSGK